jgi:hypothetical protein
MEKNIAKKGFIPKLVLSKKLLTNVFFGLSAVLVLFMVYYTYVNLSKYLDMRNEISVNETLHNSLTEKDTLVQNELNKVNDENSALKQQIYDEIDLVLPSFENHTYLTRTLEKFETDNNRLRDPFNISNLQYQKQTKPDGMPYTKLPFKMTIHSSYNNFFKFLQFVQNSGTLSDGTRLLDIDSITINFTTPKGDSENTSGQDEINFNISMNAYIRSQS